MKGLNNDAPVPSKSKIRTGFQYNAAQHHCDHKRVDRNIQFIFQSCHANPSKTEIASTENSTCKKNVAIDSYPTDRQVECYR